MTPVFTRRKGQLYGYYVSPKLMPGTTRSAGADALTRVPCRLLDDLVRRRLIDLAGVDHEALSTTVLREVVTRVEVHGDTVQMVLSLTAIGGLQADLRDLSAVEAKLRVGDRLSAEQSRVNHVRIMIPIRMKMRGGRTWLEDAEIKTSRKATAARLAAIKRLREAHDAFKPSRSALARQPSRVRLAQKPLNDVSKIDWVFLAPGIQSGILCGRLDPATIARLEKQTSIPLSWAAQRRLLEPVCAMTTPLA